MKIAKFLMEDGVKLATKGFDYLVYAIKLCKKDRTVLFNMLKLYQTIGNKFKDDHKKVERAMRNAKPTGLSNCEYIKYCLIQLGVFE